MDTVRHVAHGVSLGMIVAAVVFGIARLLPTDALSTKASRQGSEGAKRFSPTFLAAVGLTGAFLLLLSYA